MFDSLKKKKVQPEVIPGPDMNKCLVMYDEIMAVLCKDGNTTILEWDVTMALVAQQILQHKSQIAIHTEISKVAMIPVPVPVHMEEDIQQAKKVDFQHFN